MKRKNTFVFSLWMLAVILTTSCIHDIEYDADEFDGKILSRITGYGGISQDTNDWMYFNLRTGEVFNENFSGEDIKEGEQIERTDWDFAFCGYHMRTNSGTSGHGRGGALDAGSGEYENWTSSSQLPADAAWVTDTDKDVYVTYSQKDWYSYLNKNGLDENEHPWFDPNSGPQRTLTSANKLLDNAIAVSGPPMTYTPSYHTYIIRCADGETYFKLQIVSWYNTHTEIDDTGGQLSYYIDKLN
ncbi:MULTISPECIES: HmuY family protein [Bacteroides]|uniref:HmuY family protein n=1 Tax=Bacteroides oleiciplenus YIT 12058 TaxID=742727 RepID=K9E5A2_9BACE|nr:MULTISPECIES: HmuY family protein [Bacteroides]EKU92319.1 hypothetical protein HMPREF9447_00769 [Bacteroides oleiciplenus YIT 12058]UYI66283.1 MAG: HmuY family protein [Bacteroides ovatus]